MRLPAEIRLQILSHVLESSPGMPNIKTGYGMALIPKCLHTLGLNRVLYHEVSELLYRNIAFSFDVYNFRFDPVITWLQDIGPVKRRHLARNPSLTIVLRRFYGRDESNIYHFADGGLRLIPASVARWTAFCGSGSRYQLRWCYIPIYYRGWQYGEADRRQLKELVRRLKKVNLQDKSRQVQKIVASLERCLK